MMILILLVGFNCLVFYLGFTLGVAYTEKGVGKIK